MYRVANSLVRHVLLASFASHESVMKIAEIECVSAFTAETDGLDCEHKPELPGRNETFTGGYTFPTSTTS